MRFVEIVRLNSCYLISIRMWRGGVRKIVVAAARVAFVGRFDQLVLVLRGWILRSVSRLPRSDRDSARCSSGAVSAFLTHRRRDRSRRFRRPEGLLFRSVVSGRAELADRVIPPNCEEWGRGVVLRGLGGRGPRAGVSGGAGSSGVPSPGRSVGRRTSGYRSSRSHGEFCAACWCRAPLRAVQRGRRNRGPGGVLTLRVGDVQTGRLVITM